MIRFILVLIVSIIIVITPVEARKGGHDHGGPRGGGQGHDHGGGPGHGNGHDHGGDPDNGHENGNDNGNGGTKQGREHGGGGECASVNNINPCMGARPKPRQQPVEIAPGVFQYYGAFGQVIGTAILTSSPELVPVIVKPIPAKPQPVAIVKKSPTDPEQQKAIVVNVPRETIAEPEVRKRTILPPEKSADQILDVLIIQALERAPIGVQSVPACECPAQQ